jgi:histidinol-phosphate phosphatase family protein
MERFVLLDRDGVINRRIVGGYVTAWEEFQFLPGALEGLALLARRGVSALIISNQACVGKGLLAPEMLQQITRLFVKQIEDRGGRIGGVYYCPHRPEEGCGCRKPKPGLLFHAQMAHGFRFSETYLIGDSPSDMATARAVGCPGLLIAEDGVAREPMPMAPPEWVFPDLAEAARFIIAHPLPSEPSEESAGQKVPLA